jgi:hypothetical protein
MIRKQTSAAVAAFLLSILLIGCGGAEDAAEAPAETTVAQAPAADPTKPPPVVVAADTATPAAGGEATNANDAPAGDAADAPALPTPLPTVAPTEAPPTVAPTDTPVPTAVPPTAAPVVVQPTAVPPTATVVPPTPAPQVGANGLIATNFAVQSRAELTVNGSVWFEFTVANQTGGEVSYNALGVMPRKNGVDRGDWYQQSYGGPDSTIKPGGLSWEDRIKLPEAGDYTLRLVVCFDGFDACLTQRGTWHTLSPEIPVTIR